MYNLSLEHIVKKVLNESLSTPAYHFTEFYRFYKMVDYDYIMLSPIERDKGGNKDDILSRNGRYDYYMSATRQRNSNVGYPGNIGGFDVRLTLNSDAFNSNLHSMPINFFYNPKGKETDKQRYTNMPDRDMWKYHHDVESEDRVYSNQRYLHDLSKWILRVDILIPPILTLRTRNEIYDILNSKIGDRVFLYRRVEDFDFQKNEIKDTSELTVKNF